MNDTINKEELRQALYQLDWVLLLAKAIAARPTSWRQDPVWEWRNASDEICDALIAALEEQGVLKTLKERVLGHK